MRSGQILQRLIGVDYQRQPNTLKFRDKVMETQYQLESEKLNKANQECVICYLILCHSLAVLYISINDFNYQFLTWQITLLCILMMWILLNYLRNVQKSLKFQGITILIYWFTVSLYVCYQQITESHILQSHVIVILYILIFYLIFQCLRNIYIKILVTFLVSANVSLVNIQDSHFYSYCLITSGIIMLFIIDFRNEIIQRYIYYKEVQARKENEQLNNFIENCHNEQIIILKKQQIFQNPLIFSGDFSDERDSSVVISENDLKILHRNQISKLLYPQDCELLNYLSQIKLLNQDCVPQKLISQLSLFLNSNQEFQNQSQFFTESNVILNQFKKYIAYLDMNNTSRLKHPLIDRFQVRIANCVWQSQNAIVLILNPNYSNSAPFVSNSSLTINSNNSNQIFQSISHELKTPINAMYLMVQSCQTILKNLSNTKFEQKKEIISILSDVQHNNQLLQFKVNDLLDLKSFENNTFKIVRQEFILRDTLDDVKELFFNQFQEKGISFSIQCHLNHQILYTDENRLKQLLINIVGNALKFTLAGNVIVLIEEVNQDYIQIQVIDSGIGIPINIQNYLFALDYRHHEFKTSGVGLGLTISKLLVGELGPDSDIHVDSKPDVGTTISFLIFRKLFIHRESRQYYLPEEKIGKNRIQSIQIKHSDQLINTGSHKEIFYPTSSANTQLPKQNILIVDDTSINIIALRCLIERLCKDKFEISAAYNGLQAVEMVQKMTYDLIFMDINMPLMDGIQATKIIREIEQLQKRHRSKIIVVTAYSDQEIVKKSMENGADICFAKPIKQKELQELLTIQKYDKNDSIVLI